MTKYHPVYEVNKIIKGYAVKYNKSIWRHAHSLWYFDDDGELVICTDEPGVWIGKAGKDIEQLKNELNAAITKRNTALKLAYERGKLTFKPDVVRLFETIKLVECNF